MADALPIAVVLTPDALGHALLESSAAGVLREWRDQRIRLVVDRVLILRYLRLLHRLGTPERLLRWWGWWLASTEKVAIVPEGSAPPAGVDYYEHLAKAGGAALIVYWAGLMPAPAHPDGPDGVRWVTVRDLIAGIGPAVLTPADKS